MLDEKNVNLKASGDAVDASETNLGAIVVNGTVICVYWIYAIFAIKFYGGAFGKFNSFQVTIHQFKLIKSLYQIRQTDVCGYTFSTRF